MITINTTLTSVSRKAESNIYKTRVNIQLFRAATDTYRVFAYFSNSGKIIPIVMRLATLRNGNSNPRPIFYSFSGDSGKRDDGSYSNSMPAMDSLIHQPASPYNSMIVTGSVTSALIPFDKKWDNKLHNEHTFTLLRKAAAVASSTMDEATKTKAYEKLWEEYQDAEAQLEKAGLLIENNIIVANTLVPAITLSQVSASKNAFLDAEKVFNNPKSKATYAPLINSISATIKFTNSTADGNFVYGASDKAFSASCDFFDYRMNKVNGRIIMRGFRKDNFEDFTSRSTFARIEDASLRLGSTEHGGYSSIFSLEGDFSYYQAELSDDEIGIEEEVAEISFDSPFSFDEEF